MVVDMPPGVPRRREFVPGVPRRREFVPLVFEFSGYVAKVARLHIKQWAESMRVQGVAGDSR